MVLRSRFSEVLIASMVVGACAATTIEPSDRSTAVVAKRSDAGAADPAGVLVGPRSGASPSSGGATTTVQTTPPAHPSTACAAAATTLLGGPSASQAVACSCSSGVPPTCPVDSYCPLMWHDAEAHLPGCLDSGKEGAFRAICGRYNAVVFAGTDVISIYFYDPSTGQMAGALQAPNPAETQCISYSAAFALPSGTCKVATPGVCS